MVNRFRAVQYILQYLIWFQKLRLSNRHGMKRVQLSGFTLVEVLIVIAIIGTLAAIAIPAYNSYLMQVKYTTVINDIRQIEKQLLAFETFNAAFPETLADAGLTLIDAWGNPYQYTLIRGKPLKGKGKVTPRKDKSLHPLNSDFDLYSIGPDGQTNNALTAKASHDDIIRAGDGRYVGVAENY